MPVELVMALEDAFECEIPDEEAEELQLSKKRWSTLKLTVSKLGCILFIFSVVG